jgi:hypothetical protein
MQVEDIVRLLMSGGKLVVSTRPKSLLNPAEQDLADSLVRISQKHGTFDESGCGIYAAYESGAVNEDQNIGVKCSNCVMYLGADKCKIVNLPVEATGKCRFAVIPDGVVKTS